MAEGRKPIKLVAGYKLIVEIRQMRDKLSILENIH